MTRRRDASLTRRVDAPLNDAPRRSTLRALLLAAVATVSLALPAGAGASFASTGFGSTLEYQALAGETNNLTVSKLGADFILDDPGAPITAFAPCVLINPNRASCPAGSVVSLQVDLSDLGDEMALDATFPKLQFGGSISGGDGSDTVTILADGGFIGIFGGLGDDNLIGGPGQDFFLGGDGLDTLTGNGGGDGFDGEDGNDNASGGPGDDFFSSGPDPDGADTLSGGPGVDSVSYSGRAGNVSIDFDDVADDGESGEGDNVGSDVEDAEGGSGSDVLTGNASANNLRGGDGNDAISGADGDDEIVGDDGNDNVSGDGADDRVDGGDGADRISGGAGDDSMGNEFFDGLPDTISGGPGLDAYQDYSLASLTISLNGVADDGFIDPFEGPRTDNVGADIENLSGGPGNDTLTGNDAANEIDGNDGNDVISGFAGPDALFGGDGDDNLDAGAGIDVLDSGGGVDTLRSRDSDPDEVSCGSSVDTLLADSLDEFPATCDSFSLGALIAKPKVKLNEKGKGKITVACPIAEGIDCAVTIEIGKGKPVAMGTGTVASGQTEKVKLKLTKAGQETNANPIKAPATTTMTDAGGAKVSTFEDKVTLTR